MLVIAGFLAPYLIALAAFPLLLRRVPFAWIAQAGTCLLILWSSWLIPADSPMLRFVASISAAMLAMKVIDVSIDLRQGRVLVWKDYADFLTNPFTLVRRSLELERRPPRKESLIGLVKGAVGCAICMALLLGLFKVNWSNSHFLVEHVAKVVALMLALTYALAAAAAIWRLSGGVARDFMDKPFSARTPAEFWRRYNRNVQQFFWQDLFKGNGGRRSPIRSMLFVFALSAILHEWIFYSAIGRVQGYQAAFFILQGLAAAATARVKVQGGRAIPWVAGTLIFNLLSSVLFFASINGVTRFYSQELPAWLRGW
jgi:MBOAT, membrane-bound O-acyltransferase family